MRVVGGHSRGRRLLVPKGSSIRITADRVKESIFNILQPLEGRSFLDLFAGTGNVGIEAMSRGAKPVFFVEVARLHAGTIKKNIDLCGFESGFEIVPKTVKKGIELLSMRDKCFDIIFADPPYEKGLIEKTLGILGAHRITSKNGILVMEHSSNEECCGNDDFVVTDQRKYGDTVISFLQPN
ncbi:MAG: 16S rRNA (guanine(966)-N(2))-methyltransferase RsmD [Deltaproteobacteria bacterium]|nr:16S rRNA (guanine(966)-N(2))-methyltransferase RsmD [Deltaproteobacteria bacterium]MBN2846816.1 16S rRNA (guanine(966)-N(2))-methyltransferase RsmD [Deltaproteobacteria bacterium]